MAKFKQLEKFAEWVDEVDEQQQEALLGLEDDEEFVPAYEMQDVLDSDAEVILMMNKRCSDVTYGSPTVAVYAPSVDAATV
ncbi:TPA: hypothetical protein ACH3X1_009815 [Trebouxia sp. C0004]